MTTENILLSELDVSDEDLFLEICQNIDTSSWCKINLYGPDKNEYFRGGWRSFKEIVKYKVRFVFFDSNNKDRFEDEYHEYLNPYHVMSEVGKTIKQLKLIKTFKPNTLKVFRGRQHVEKEIVENAKDLGAPPSSIAKANRMSPAGISMFYGGFDKNTCINEIIENDWDTDSVITYGQFENTETLNLIDFTSIKKIPSLFDILNRNNREYVKFILNFIQDLSHPIKPDDSVHIEYVPTQIVSEYLKVSFSNDVKIDGIIYNSVKNIEGKCVALFIDNNDCLDKYPKSELDDEVDKVITEAFGISQSKPTPVEKVLNLDNKTIKKQKVKHTTIGIKKC